ncbi:MAG: polyphosphate polymerase domain-containing protein [Lachnospiraceae bacterium]|nr:polyphosphate polymerase domain-containing protein [Lachnospiraceae bacterium]
MTEEKIRPGWRHEEKYRIDAQDAVLIRHRIEDLLQADVHAAASGSYEIRSVYFDDLYDTCYRKNEAGSDPRAKFRIRCYNADSQRIALEKKSKKNLMTRKESCLLTYEQAKVLIEGGVLSEDAAALSKASKVLQEFCLLQRTRLFRPKVMVVYQRMPFVMTAGNVRITLDLNIAAGWRPEQLFDAHPFLKPAMEAGRHLLEVKYDALLPRSVQQALELGHLQRESFSKYYLCRREEKKIHEYLW